MNQESIDVVVIGAGQAGLSTSYHLKQQGLDHVVLEEGRVGESWRSGRWDSFTMVTPNWTVQLPGFAYQGDEPDGFMDRTQLVDYFDRYQASFDPPVRTGVTIVAVDEADGGFELLTSHGNLKAKAVVVATGSYRRPKVPAFAASLPPGIPQVHSSAYRNPSQLPEGAVLVVGTGQSGAQIAEELHEAGRRLYVSVSGCPRIPRRYRGKDIVWWGKMGGLYERTVDALQDPAERWACHPQSSGRNGGHDIYLRQLAREGVTLTGRVQSVDGGVLTGAPDLSQNLRKADEFAEKVLLQLDDAVSKMGMPLPEDENPRGVGSAVPGEERPIRQLDLSRSGITSIVWATGYTPDFSFVHFPVFDSTGRPVQRQGVTATPGLYFIGLEWLHKPKSGLLFGVGEDAAHIASVIAGQAQSKSESKSHKVEAPS